MQGAEGAGPEGPGIFEGHGGQGADAFVLMHPGACPETMRGGRAAESCRAGMLRVHIFKWRRTPAGFPAAKGKGKTPLHRHWQ